MTSTRSVAVSRTSPSASIIASRFSRSLYVGRHRTARGIAVSSRDAEDVAPERRAGRSARPPGGPLGDTRGGVLQGHRVPARGGADPRVSAPDRASSRSTGKAKELPGIGKTIENKVVEVVEDGEMHALTKRRGLVPAGVVDFLRLPGVGPKTAARIWTQLGITSLDGLEAAAEGDRLRELSGMGARSEEKILKALEAGVGDHDEERHLLAKALPAVRRVRGELEAHPAAIAVSEAGSVRRRRETVRDLDLIATSSDPPALIDAFCGGEWVAEVVARGDTKATVVGHDALRFDLRVVPPECYGNVLQHFTGSKDHNIALREDAQRRGLSISEYGVTNVETGEVVDARDRGRAVRVPRLPLHSARAARGDGGDRRGPRRRAPGSGRAGRPPGRAALPLDVVDRRRRLDRGDGAHGEGARLPVPLHHRPLPLPARRTSRGAVDGDRGAQRAPEVVSRAAWHRGQHPRRWVARRGRRPARSARLGRGVAPHLVRSEPDRADPRRDGQPARRLHRSSHRADGC